MEVHACIEAVGGSWWFNQRDAASGTASFQWTALWLAMVDCPAG